MSRRIAVVAAAAVLAALAVPVALLAWPDDHGPRGVAAITVGTTQAEVQRLGGWPLRVIGPECWQYKRSPAWQVVVVREMDDPPIPGATRQVAAERVDVCFEGTGRVVRFRWP